MATVGASPFATQIQRLGVVVALSLLILHAEFFIGVKSRGVPLITAERNREIIIID